MPQVNFLTGGEECQRAAKVLSAFFDESKSNASGAIPQQLLSLAQAVAVFRGREGVSIARLTKGGWSAPCAVVLESDSGTEVNSEQDTVVLIMSETALFDLALDRRLKFGEKHSFSAGKPRSSTTIAQNSDLVVWVRFKNFFTNPHLVEKHMHNWCISEDSIRQQRWHRKNVSWVEVLTNRISTDRSSIGNALYVVINMACPASLCQVKGLNLGKLNQKAQEHLTPSETSPEILPTSSDTSHQIVKYDVELPELPTDSVFAVPYKEPPSQPGNYYLPPQSSYVMDQRYQYNQPSSQSQYQYAAHPLQHQYIQHPQHSHMVQPGAMNYGCTTTTFTQQTTTHSPLTPFLPNPVTQPGASILAHQASASIMSSNNGFVNVQKVSQAFYSSSNNDVQHFSESQQFLKSPNFQRYI